MNFDFLRILLAIVISSHAAAGETRKWTNNEGKVITAEFVSSDGSEVALLMNGKESKYALDKLSAADREFVSKQATDSPKTDKPMNGDNAKTGYMDHMEIRQPAYATAKEYMEGSNAKAVYDAFAKGNYPKDWNANKGPIEEMFS
jgi:hypothetical protein